MNKVILFACIAAAALFTSCDSSKVNISGRFAGCDAKMVYLEQVTPLAQATIDSASLSSDGSYRFVVKNVTVLPSLYNILYNGERIPLLIAGGDDLIVNSAGSVVKNYSVEGSIESEFLRRFYQPYIAGIQRLDEIASSEVIVDSVETSRNELTRAYMTEYYRIKREQLRFIIENKTSLAAVYALYQRIPGDLYLFNLDSDAIYYRTVADAIEESCPQSQYLPMLLADIARMTARINLTSNVPIIQFPDVEIPDMYGKQIKLSSLKDKVVLIDFWSAELGNSNALNAELKEIYVKYAPKGFEVYQIGTDTSKSLWITAVQEQQLPWISVCDFKGKSSPALGLYNIQKLPANFLIDRNGNIAGKDLYGRSLENKLSELTK